MSFQVHLLVINLPNTDFKNFWLKMCCTYYHTAYNATVQEEMQVPRITVYIVHITIFPETLYTHIFNSHQTRKKYFVKHSPHMYERELLYSYL